MWTVPEGPVGLVGGSWWSWWSWKSLSGRRGAGGTGRGCPEAPPQRAEQASQSRFVRLRRGRGDTDHVPEGPGGRQHPSEGCTSSGARGSVPNVHSMEQCSHIQTLGLTLAYLLERFGAKALGISHQKLSLNL